ncbi:MAG: DUF167 domain-containing protein [Verrucomicrobiota bacterium]
MALSCTLALKIIPNASRSQIVGWMGTSLKVKVSAPALEGKANDSICKYLAEQLGLHRNAVILAQGNKSSLKVVRISGLDATTVKSRVNLILAKSD